MTQLIDVYGNPLKLDELREPQTSRAGSLPRPMSDYPVRGLTPQRLAGMLHDADAGQLAAQCDLFEEMEERDAHLLAELGKRKRALITLDYSIVAPRNADKAELDNTAWLQEVIEDLDDFEDVILNMADAIGKAFANLEIEWRFDQATWMPLVHWRPQGWFMHPYNEPNNIRLVSADGLGEGLQPFGWIRHIHKAKSGYISRSGLSRVLVWPFLFKNYGVRDLAELLEIYGIPVRLGTYPGGATKQERNTLLQALVSMGHNAAGIIPEGMKVEFMEAAQGGHAPHQAMIDWCERSMSKAILGGTLTSQADGKSSTHALGNVHNEVRHDLLVGDVKQIAGTLKRDLLYPLLALNGRAPADPRRTPSIVFDTQQPENIEAYSKALPHLVRAGMRIPVSWAHDKLRIPAASEGEAILEMTATTAAAIPEDATPPARAAASRVAACGHSHDDDAPDALDHLAALGMAGWQPALTDMLAPVREALSQAISDNQSLDQFQAQLPQLLKHMQLESLADPLAQASFTARLAGESGLEP